MRFVPLAFGLLFLLAGCSKDGTIPNPFPSNPTKITVAQQGISPEGVQYDDLNRQFLVSSRTKGQIGAVEDDGTYTVFADDSRLVSTIGLNLDVARRRLLAAVSDIGVNTARTSPATVRKLAAVAIFNADNGNLLRYIDLGALRPSLAHFANDIAVDADGNAYITDSLSPIIYKIDPQGNASVFLEDPQLSGGTGFGLNGIVYHPAGYLLVAKSNDGTLFKVPLKSPANFTKVSSSQSLVGADGLLLQNTQTLLVVSGSQSTVFRLSSTDAWETVNVTGTFATGATSPTTITRRLLNDAYVLYPYQATAPQFEIAKVRF
jgi:sugar lactone lactonase YvrE